MRKLTWVAIVLISTFGFAKDKDGEKKDKYADWPTARITQLKAQDITSADYKVTDNRVNPINSGPARGGMGMAGGAFSSAPAHFIQYNVLLETDTELIHVSRNREVTLSQPDLKVNTDVKWKSQGPKAIELIDGRGKKFEMQIVRRVAKEQPKVLVPRTAPEDPVLPTK